MMTDLNVTSLVGLLARYDPSAIDRLRARFPEAASVFEPGKRLGGTDEKIHAALEGLADEALRVARDRAETAARFLDRRLRRSRLTRLAANLVGGIAAAGVIGAVIVEQRFVALLTAGITLASSSLALVADYLGGAIGGTGGLHALHSRAATALTSVAVLDGEFRLLPFAPVTPDERLALVRRANVLAAEVRQIEFEAGAAR
ncbi:hypothetical protein SAE02_77380 [Skermanella aerolata]|uniref:Uncharacterized protein n=1 Tax=Skermanella aerolata TaxID=393310 RepID=A0A512E528_9PROT|nr:hypothetical protein [Skermanella aerolata]KJB89947.1 hypothetical protein N826_09775 [Skermanella aerolata KACC 11604]GEO43590.1 hypothetical protein SAE02_77380 [Skermanella aerolata]